VGSEPVWGLLGDIPLVGDLNGDFVDDMVTFDPTTGIWNGRQRNGQQVFTEAAAPRLGTRGDFPFIANVSPNWQNMADDIVIWRPSDGKWSAKETNGTTVFNNLAWVRPTELTAVPTA
jgi:hypothetical protein